MVAAIIGGVIGAFAGGIPAWALAKRQSNETLKRDREQRVQQQKALAFSAAVKLIAITNSIISLSDHIKSCMSLRQNPDYQHMQPWQVLIPMVGHTDEGSIRFTSEEMAVFAAAGSPQLMQDMMLLAIRHSSSLAVFMEYCVMLKEFRSISPKPESFDGQIGSTMLTLEEIEDLKRHTIPLNNLAMGLEQGIDQDMKLARTVAMQFGSVTAQHFKLKHFISIDFPSDEELAARRKPRDPTTLST